MAWLDTDENKAPGRDPAATSEVYAFIEKTYDEYLDYIDYASIVDADAWETYKEWFLLSHREMLSSTFTKSKLKKYFLKFIEEDGALPVEDTNPFKLTTISMDRFVPTEPRNQASTKEENMHNDSTIQTRAKEYLTCRLNSKFYEVDRTLMRKFGLLDEEPPKNAEEIAERIKSGMYVIRDKSDWLYGLDRFRWRNPETKEDRPGYESAVKVLEKDFQHAKDLIVVKSADDGLAALNEFQSKYAN